MKIIVNKKMLTDGFPGRKRIYNYQTYSDLLKMMQSRMRIT
jgi:hypothetical protein